MEWMANYWFIFVGVIIAVMFFLGGRKNVIHEGSGQDGQRGGGKDGKPRGGHGCCG